MTEIYFPIKNKNKTLELERKIEELKEKINELKNRIVINTAMLDDSVSKATVKKNYIPKAKIKEVIKELSSEKHQSDSLKYYSRVSQQDFGYIDAVDMLEELLESEE